jgi:hypothetical protein
MSQISVADERTGVEISWRAAHHAWLETELHRLRLLLQRRVLWLRRRWKHDPLQAWQGVVVSDAQADSLLAGEDIRAEQAFYREDPEAATLGAALADGAVRSSQLRRALADAGTPPPLELLAQLLGLSGFERDVLLLALAPELDPDSSASTPTCRTTWPASRQRPTWPWPCLASS